MSSSDKLLAYLTSKNIKYKVANNGVNFEDPFKSKDPRLTLYYYFDTGLCKGYRSQFKGPLYKVIAEIEGCSEAEAKTIIGEVRTYKSHLPKPEKEKKEGLYLPPYCRSLIDPDRAHWITWQNAMVYLKKRGFTVDDVKRYQLHYCWAGPQDWRIVIPYFYNTKFVFWQARDVLGGPLRYTFPKKDEIGVGAGDFIYNIDQQTDELILCEGPFDAMTIGGAALGGASLSNTQLNIVLKKQFKKVILAIDNDKAGFDMLDRVARQLFPYGLKISYAVPEGGKDWNEIGKEKSYELLSKPKTYKAPLKILNRFGL